MLVSSSLICILQVSHIPVVVLIHIYKMISCIKHPIHLVYTHVMDFIYSPSISVELLLRLDRLVWLEEPSVMATPLCLRIRIPLLIDSGMIL